VTYEVIATFDFSVYDSIDKDYVSINSREVSKTFTRETKITLSCDVNIEDLDEDFESIDFYELEIDESFDSKSHDFGSIEPFDGNGM
jgi:hypothetical protein